MEELRIDMRDKSYQNAAAGARNEELVFKLNHTLPTSQEYKDVLHELFDGRIGENSFLHAPLAGAAFEKITIGSGVYINSNLLAMARGGITIEDDVQIAANVQLLTNNHDPYDRQILTCKPITILPGVTVGRYAIVGAASVVTRDVGDYEVVVGNPARLVRKLDAERFE